MDIRVTTCLNNRRIIIRIIFETMCIVFVQNRRHKIKSMEVNYDDDIPLDENFIY